MIHAQKLADAVERSERVAKWNERLDALNDKGVNRAEFCRRYKIEPSQLSRHCSGRMNARWETIDKIESALEKEGV